MDVTQKYNLVSAYSVLDKPEGLGWGMSEECRNDRDYESRHTQLAFE
jgi:hypothetical protein